MIDQRGSGRVPRLITGQPEHPPRCGISFAGLVATDGAHPIGLALLDDAGVLVAEIRGKLAPRVDSHGGPVDDGPAREPDRRHAPSPST